MERSQRQSDNVYRFIKQFADTPRKPDAATVRPKEVAAPAPAPAPVRRPEAATAVASPTNIPASNPAATPEVVAPTPAPVSTAAAEPVAPAPAASAATAAAPVVEEEEELQLVTQVQPEFPRGMQSTAESGKVTVAFTVQPNGTVTDTSVVSASHRRFGKPARDAVAQWRFAPIKAPRAVQVEIAFSLQ
jgi:TonB family protein